MKYFYSLFLIFIFFYAKGQSNTEILLNNTWYLTDFDEGSEYGFYGTMGLSELEEITLIFYMEDEILNFQTEVCQTKTGIVQEIIDGQFPEIYFGFTEISGDECIDPYAQGYQNAYFAHMYDKKQYWFNITENTDGSLTLGLGSPNFCTATFTNEFLSNEEISSLSFSIYPNPVLDKLTIENPKLEIETLKITDASGKHIFQKNTNVPKIEIDFTHYPNGVYFITIESNGKTTTEKVIKK